MLAENGAARRLLESHGYREVRRFYRMQIDLGAPSEPSRWPDGISVSTFRIEDAREFKDALDEAFEDDWGFHRSTFEQWKRDRLEAPETDTSLWFIARDGGEIAGIIRCDGERFGGGWVGALGVRKPWRGRGLGNALLRHAFAEFHRRGAPHVGLGVDAQNESGALRLYEKAGMRVVSADVVFEKELA
jgi:ribosomal protein S18 acetylase RimI-like enzyme